MPGKIFISYRRDDEPAEARSVRDRLAQVFGDEAIFMDVNSLVAGDQFKKELNRALDDCAVFIAVIGPKWKELLDTRRQQGVEDYVVAEISAALGRDILVIPTLVRKASLPDVADLPRAIADLPLRQAHVVSHEKFSNDISELARIIRDKAGIGEAKSNAWRKWLPRLAAAIFISAVLAGAYFYYAMPDMGGSSKTHIAVFTHEAGITSDVAKDLRAAIATSEAIFAIQAHVDRRRGDAIYISDRTPVRLARAVVNVVYMDVAYIFPVDYSTKSSNELTGVDIAVGLMSSFEYYAGNDAEKPYHITPAQLNWLVEEGLDQSTFTERLKYIAPARDRAK